MLFLFRARWCQIKEGRSLLHLPRQVGCLQCPTNEKTMIVCLTVEEFCIPCQLRQPSQV